MATVSQEGAWTGEHLPGHAGVNVNFDPTKPGMVRTETLRRRRLAWERGMQRYHGVHLLEAEKQNHQWDRTTLTYLPDTPHWTLARNLVGP